MKYTAQIIALMLFGNTAMQIIFGIGSSILFIQLWAKNVFVNQIRLAYKSKKELRKIRKEIENNKWIIE